MILKLTLSVSEKNAEQEVVKALTRFHYREIDHAWVELTKSKWPKVEKTSTRNENCTTKPAHSTPAANTDVTITNVKEIAMNIQAGLKTTFLDTTISKGERFDSQKTQFLKDSILDVRTHVKPTETFQYTHFTSPHPPGVKKGFIKGEALRLLRTNSSSHNFLREVTRRS